MHTNWGWLIVHCALALAMVTTPAAQAQAPTDSRIQAIAFDAFPIFDPRPIADLAEQIYPGQGTALMAAWRTRQFEYQWLRALSGQYADFVQTTEEGLVFAARQVGLELGEQDKRRLMTAHRNLSVWPDAEAAILALKNAGLRLVFLSNMTESMLDEGLRRADLSGAFEAIYSTDQIRSYKPAAAAYQLASDGLGLPKENILFVAFAGWDVAGAKWFGYPTFWVNRTGAPPEMLGVAPDAEGRDLQALVDHVLGEAR